MQQAKWSLEAALQWVAAHPAVVAAIARGTWRVTLVGTQVLATQSRVTGNFMLTYAFAGAEGLQATGTVDLRDAFDYLSLLDENILGGDFMDALNAQQNPYGLSPETVAALRELMRRLQGTLAQEMFGPEGEYITSAQVRGMTLGQIRSLAGWALGSFDPIRFTEISPSRLIATADTFGELQALLGYVGINARQAIIDAGLNEVNQMDLTRAIAYKVRQNGKVYENNPIAGNFGDIFSSMQDGMATYFNPSANFDAIRFNGQKFIFRGRVKSGYPRI